MITRFIGSATELMTCEKIGLVYSDLSLTESEINKYVPGYVRFNLVTILDRIPDDGLGHFEYHPPESGVVFNAIIMYTIDMRPIGFTHLGQVVETAVYGIEDIRIDMNFVINYKNETFLDLDFNNYSYAAHIYNEANVHKELFNKFINNAISYHEISSIIPKESEFTDNILSGLGGNLYRYSGDFYIGKSRITSQEYELPRNKIYDLKLDNEGICSKTELMKFDNDIYLISWKRDVINFYKFGDNWITITTDQIRDAGYGNSVILDVGSNFVLCRNNLSYLLLDTDKLRTGVISVVNSLPLMNHLDLRFVKNPIDRSIMFYRYNENTGVDPISLELIEIFDILGLDNIKPLIKEIVAATPGLVLYRTGVADLNQNFSPSSLRIQSNIPLTIRDVISTDKDSEKFNIYELTEELREITEETKVKQQGYPDDTPDNVIRYVTYGNKVELLANSAIEYVFNFDDIELISNKAILIKRRAGGSTNWVLLEIVNDFSLNSFNYKYIAYNLGNKGNWRKLDLISKNQVNPINRKMDILMSPIDGTLWRMTCDNWDLDSGTVKLRIL